MSHKHAHINDAGFITMIVDQPEAVLMVEDGADITPNTHYGDLSDRAVKVRSPMPIDVFDFVFSDIPCPCWVEVRGPVEYAFQCDDNEATLTFDVPGDYSVEFHPAQAKWAAASFTLTVSGD